MIPVIRDLDGYIYFRENDGRLLAGGFEPIAKPAFEDGMIPGWIWIRIFLALIIAKELITHLEINLSTT